MAVGTAVIDVELNGKKASKELKKIGGVIGGINKTAKTTNKAFGFMIKALGAFGAFKATSHVAEMGKSMSLLSDYTGVASSNISKLRNAFSSIGVSGKSVDAVLSNITDGLARLSSGDGAMASRLASMGINAWDRNGGIKDPRSVMYDIADWAKRQKDSGRRTTDIIYWLRQNFNIEQQMAEKMMLGSSGLKAFVESQSKDVGNLSTQQAKQLKELSDTYNKLSATLSSTFSQMVADFSPALKEIAKDVTLLVKFVGDWWHKMFAVEPLSNDELSEQRAKSAYTLFQRGLLSKMQYEEELRRAGIKQEFVKSSNPFDEGKQTIRFTRDGKVIKELRSWESKWLRDEYEEWERAEEAYKGHLAKEKEEEEFRKLIESPNFNGELVSVADSTGEYTIVNLDVKNSAQVNPDGSVTQSTEINGESMSADGNVMNTNYATVAQTGGHV